MFHDKPIIGIAGAIGSGKTYVSQCFEKWGWKVISSDELARRAYSSANVLNQVRAWWGDGVFKSGQVDRSAIARIIFNSPAERERLEGLIHPAVAQIREATMELDAGNPQVMGFVWDSPLLFETGLDKQCDWIVFIDAPLEVRQQRVFASRGWSADELRRRENSQLPLDSKKKMSHDVIRNADDASPGVRSSPEGADPFIRTIEHADDSVSSFPRDAFLGDESGFEEFFPSEWRIDRTLARLQRIRFATPMTSGQVAVRLACRLQANCWQVLSPDSCHRLDSITTIRT